MNLHTTVIIIIIVFFVFFLIFNNLKNVGDGAEVYNFNVKLKECQTDLDKKIKQYKRYKILTKT